MKKPTPRILLVTRNFPPLVGGMERLIYHAYGELAQEFNVGVVGPAGCQDHLEADTPVSCFPAMPPAQFLLCCQWRTYAMTRAFAPDLIVAGSGVTAPASLLAGIRFKVPILCHLHGLDLVAANPVYRLAFIPAIRACDGFIVNSHNTFELARSTGIDAWRISILHPGVEIPRPDKTPDCHEFRKKIRAGSRPILLSVGRLTRRKGIVEFIDKCLPDIVREVPEILYVIIGSEARLALSGSGGMIQKILDTACKKGVENHVVLMQDVDDETLSAAYAASRLLVFPVIDQPDDVEGFGMVALEAAAHGLPTVAFAVGGVVDAVKEGVSGYLVRNADYVGFRQVVLNFLLCGKETTVRRKSCRQFAEPFAWNHYGDQLRKLCSGMMGNQVRYGLTGRTRDRGQP